MMADQTTPDENNTPETADAAAPEATEATAPESAEDALRAEAAEYKDKMLRTLAEMENLRRRTEREIADARQYAIASFARDMLTVGDNLRRAIEAVPQEMRDSADTTLKALLEGVEVTERGLEQTLGKFGVKKIEAQGQKFDPAFHQAMFEMESADVAPGTVTQEMQTGYVIGERVLRPSFVGVSKAAKPKPVEDASATAKDGDSA